MSAGGRPRGSCLPICRRLDRRFQGLAEGEPVVIAVAGRVYAHCLRSNDLPRSEFDRPMRQSLPGSPDNVRLAVLERNGGITFLKRERAQ